MRARHVVHGLGLFPEEVWQVFEGPITALGQEWQLPDLAATLPYYSA
jgi:hypothetical protein